METGQGWEKTAPRLQDTGVDGEAALKDALVDHIIAGEKLVRLFELDDGEIAELRRLVGNLSVGENAYVEFYPASLPEEKLKTVPLKHELVSIERRDDGTALVFSSVRVETIRQELTIEDDIDSALFEAYDEIVAFRHRRYQVMDVLWVPKNGNIVDIRVDLPTSGARETAQRAIPILAERIAILLDRNFLSKSINLFPAIFPLYEADDGEVVEIEFLTSTASTKHETMRRGGKCLRKEAYHQGGKAALTTPLELYKLSVRWPRKIGEKLVSRPELELLSSMRASMGASPTLLDAVFTKCMGEDDFAFVRSRLDAYL